MFIKFLLDMAKEYFRNIVFYIVMVACIVTSGMHLLSSGVVGVTLFHTIALITVAGVMLLLLSVESMIGFNQKSTIKGYSGLQSKINKNAKNYDDRAESQQVLIRKQQALIVLLEKKCQDNVNTTIQ